MESISNFYLIDKLFRDTVKLSKVLTICLMCLYVFVF